MVVSASQSETQFCLNQGCSVSLLAADTESTISFRTEKVSPKAASFIVLKGLYVNARLIFK